MHTTLQQENSLNMVIQFEIYALGILRMMYNTVLSPPLQLSECKFAISEMSRVTSVSV